MTARPNLNSPDSPKAAPPMTAEDGQHPDSDARHAASLDNSINAELEAILNEKLAREKARRRRSSVFTLLFFVGAIGGASAWVTSSPERLTTLKQTVSDIKSLSDVKGLVSKYQAGLDKVAVRGQQIDQATILLGGDPASVSPDEQGFDQEMRDLVGEEGGPTTSERDAKLREKFKSVQESGSLTN